MIQRVNAILPTLQGWCSPEKAEMLIRCVRSADAQLCVEIGVFGGSSLIPQALALQAKGSGKIVGVDPYSNATAVLGAEEIDAEWWGDVDLQSIKAGCLAAVEQHNLAAQVELLEVNSAAAASRFAAVSIDVLHIDGNHSAEQSFADVITWLSKVRTGGYVFLDDISWGLSNTRERATTADAVEFTLQQCTWLGVVDQCLVCRKR